ncbi:hypothetical protein [Rhodococcus sp. 24CO]|uniref:hypothetical protein n=1 Tax=Rhodococcus sp. 24CO TaxID=3117460 RepID=UPI003D332D17
MKRVLTRPKALSCRRPLYLRLWRPGTLPGADAPVGVADPLADLVAYLSVRPAAAVSDLPLASAAELVVNR